MSPGMDSQTYQYISFLGDLIKRRWPMMVSIFLITLLPVLYLTVNKPVRHIAKAEIMLEQNQRVNIELSGNLSERASRHIIPPEKLNTLAEVLTSNQMIHKMIDALGPVVQKAEKQELLRHFQNEIETKVVPVSTVIEITYADVDPVRAQKVVNTLVEVFQDYYRQTVEGGGALDFYRHHFDQISARLEISLAKLNELRRKEGIQDGFQRVQVNTNRRFEELKVDQAGLVKKISETQIRITLLEEELNAQPEYLKGNIELISNPIVVEMTEKLTALELEKISLSTKYTEESREVRDITAEIDSIKREIAQLNPVVEGKSLMVLNQLHERIKGDIVAARTQLAGLQNTRKQVEEQIRGHEAEIHRLDQLAHRFTSRENAVATDKKKHSFYLGKLDDARFVQSMNQHEITSLRVIERAEGTVSNHISQLSTTLASVLLCLLMAFGTVFLMEMLRPRLNTPEQTKTLMKLPVLATISKRAA